MAASGALLPAAMLLYGMVELAFMRSHRRIHCLLKVALVTRESYKSMMFLDGARNFFLSLCHFLLQHFSFEVFISRSLHKFEVMVHRHCVSQILVSFVLIVELLTVEIDDPLHIL